MAVSFLIISIGGGSSLKNILFCLFMLLFITSPLYGKIAIREHTIAQFNEEIIPSSFEILSSGKLLILDNRKGKIVFFDEIGKIDRSISLLNFPELSTFEFRDMDLFNGIFFILECSKNQILLFDMLGKKRGIIKIPSEILKPYTIRVTTPKTIAIFDYESGKTFQINLSGKILNFSKRRLTYPNLSQNIFFSLFFSAKKDRILNILRSKNLLETTAICSPLRPINQ